MRALIVQGLLFGGEAKGATVDFLTRELKAALVIKWAGGCNASSNVELPSGHRHTFVHWGSGTFAGARTYLDQPVIIDPLAMAREAHTLAAAGVEDPYGMLRVHPRCLVATPYHIHQTRRSCPPGSTTGTGIRATRQYWLDHGDDAIFAEDLRGSIRLRDKLELLRQRLIGHEFPTHPASAIQPLSVAESFYAVTKRLGLMGHVETHQDQTVIFEGAQGVLLDQNLGLGHPQHVTWSDTTPRTAFALAESLQAERVEMLGVLRAYNTRHGAGPFPTEYRDGFGFDDPGNPENEWQGRLRYGFLDIPLLKRSLETIQHTCGGRGLDGLAVSCLDQVREKPMRVRLEAGIDCATRPDVDVWTTTETAHELELLAAHGIGKTLITGFGPTWRDREFVREGQ